MDYLQSDNLLDNLKIKKNINRSNSLNSVQTQYHIGIHLTYYIIEHLHQGILTIDVDLSRSNQTL